MYTILMVVHILVAITLIGLVLIQRGKGADMGAAFGSGASSTVFGSAGSASFLTRTTAALAAVFFVTSLSLAYLSGKQRHEVQSVTDVAAPAPAVPGAKVPVPGTNAVQDKPTEQPLPSDVPSVPGGKQ